MNELDGALAFARSLGLATSGRFEVFRGRLAELVAVLERAGDEGTFRQFMADIELNAIALTECHELAMVLPYLQAMEPGRAKSKLKIIVNGPERPTDEDPNSNHARNTMFELNLGARRSATSGRPRRHDR
jgi:hypothetical protein